MAAGNKRNQYATESEAASN